MRVAAGILGTGAYLPEHVLDNSELAVRFGLTPDWILERTGIRQRRIAAPEQACSDLAIAAARQALKNASIAPEEIGLVIVATATGDFRSPATAALVQTALAIPNALCFDLSAACSGFVHGLTVACGLVESGQCCNALLIGAEVMSSVINPDDLNTAILFGDGAGAVVIGAVPEGYGLLATDAGSDGSEYALSYVSAGGSRMPVTAETLSSGKQFMQMDGVQLFMFAMRVLGDSVMRVIRSADFTMDDINLIIPHQANRRIIEAAAARLNLPMEKMVLNLENYGNTSAASIPIALHEAVFDSRIKHGDRIVMAGFGAGLSWGSVLIHWHSDGSDHIHKKEYVHDNSRENI